MPSSSSPADEIAKIEAAAARASDAMLAWPDVLEAFNNATKLAELGRRIDKEATRSAHGWPPS